MSTTQRLTPETAKAHRERWISQMRADGREEKYIAEQIYMYDNKLAKIFAPELLSERLSLVNRREEANNQNYVDAHRIMASGLTLREENVAAYNAARLDFLAKWIAAGCAVETAPKEIK